MTPERACDFCSSTTPALFGLGAAQVVAPAVPHISTRDGGHLVVVAGRHVPSRLDLTAAELYEVEVLSLLGAAALLRGHFADWINWQENGNWSANVPERAHMHFHVYGRARGSREQPFGEALQLPRQAEISTLDLAGFTVDEQQQLGLLMQDAWNGSDFDAYRSALSQIRCV